LPTAIPALRDGKLLLHAVRLAPLPRDKAAGVCTRPSLASAVKPADYSLDIRVSKTNLAAPCHFLQKEKLNAIYNYS
jgi:hypothetical protein